MSKQVQKQLVAAAAATALVSTASTEALATAGARNLYVSVNTFETGDGKQIGTRVVDMYHYGTRNWLANHLWWATHNAHVVEIKDATDAEVDAYLDSAKAALAAKFNGTEAHG